jgi:hypothetical protein
MDRSNQRSSRRLQAVGTVLVRVDGHTVECAPLDVSMGGARVQVLSSDPAHLPYPGARVHVDFIRPRGRPAFSVEAIAVRCAAGGVDVSLRFELDRGGQEQLRAFLRDEALQLGIPVAEVGGLDAPPPLAPSIDAATGGGLGALPWLVLAAVAVVALGVVAVLLRAG